eukprot:GEMP01042501.1.p1 GENE.GEMP01042501.1~~GEMP01042501.1.p1  ORF type:complete len:401 (+),score=89.96 GEMP01042501.1:348-1550(+)
MESFDHPNVLHFCGVYDDFKHVYLVTEYCEGGNLVHSRKERTPQWQMVLLQQLISAVTYLHTNHVAHRDLRPQNVLLSCVDPPIAKLAGFGLAERLENDRWVSDFVGIPEYVAPECLAVFEATEVTHKTVVAYSAFLADIWGIGIIGAFISDDIPYSLKEVASYLEDGAPLAPWDPPRVSDEIYNIVQLCLRPDPSDRPAAKELVVVDTSVTRARATGKILKRLELFEKESKFNKAVCSVVARQLEPSDVEDLMATFRYLSKNGTISTDTFSAHITRRLASKGEKISGPEMRRLVANVDTDGRDAINWTEWAKFLLAHKLEEDTERARKSFEVLSQSGVITTGSLQKALERGEAQGENVESIMHYVIDHDITFDTYLRLLEYAHDVEWVSCAKPPTVDEP